MTYLEATARILVLARKLSRFQDGTEPTLEETRTEPPACDAEEDILHEHETECPECHHFWKQRIEVHHKCEAQNDASHYEDCFSAQDNPEVLDLLSELAWLMRQLDVAQDVRKTG